MTTRVNQSSTLKELTTLISSGSTPLGGQSVYHGDGPVMLVRSQNVQMNRLDVSDVAYISDEVDSQMKRSIVQHNDVLLNITGASIGRVARFGLKNTRANVNQHVCIIRPRPDRLNPQYLEYFLSSPVVQNDIHNRHQHGGTRQALTFAQIAEFEIPLVPLSEQRRIADILDKADTIRRKRQEAVEHYDALLDAAFAYNVGAGATDYKEWNSITLGEIADFVGGSSLPEGELFEGQEHGLLLVKVGDMNLPGNEITIKTAREWYGSPPIGFALCTQDGIVIPKRGGAIGTNKKRLLSRDALLDPNLMGIVPKDHTHTAWLFQWFQQFDLMRLVSGSTVPQLNKKDLAPLTLQLPPSECLEAFDTSSARIRASQEVAIQASHESSELFNSLVQRAFKGDL